MGGKKLCYCAFTSFETLDQIVAKLSGHCDYYIVGGQEVCPKTGSLHYHGLAYSEEAKCWKNITNPWNMCNKDDEFKKGPLAWVRYCCKLDSKVDPEKRVAAEDGVRPARLTEKIDKKGSKENKISNKEIIENGIIQLIDEERISILRYETAKKSFDRYKLDTTKLVDSDGPKGIWIYGKAGVGKSFSVRRKYPGLYLKPQNKWWDGFKGEQVVLLDDFDDKGTCLSHYIKIWADAYGFNGEVKCGTVPIVYEKFIITSQYTIEELFNPECHSNSPICDAIKRRFKFVEKTSREQDILDLI